MTSSSLIQHEIGMLRIYLRPRDRDQRVGLGRLWAAWSGEPLYRGLVKRAKQDGLLNAVAHHTHYGFSQDATLQGEMTEFQNPALTMCVEIIGSRAQLEAFCRHHAPALKGKVIVYKQLERWEV